MDLKWIYLPLMGGIIGLITNGIALKMLFWPLNPIHFGKFTVPFTPGLIPKEKDRIAKSMGTVISKQLLNEGVIANALKSQVIQDKILLIIDRIIAKYKKSELTVKEELNNLFSEMDSESLISDLKEKVEKLIEKQLTEFDFGERFVKQALVQHFEEEKGLMSRLMDEKMISALSKSLGKILNKAVSSNAHAIVSKVVDEEFDKILDLKVSKLMSLLEKKFPMFKSFILEKYNEFINENLSRIYYTLDIEKIIEERIKSFDVVQLEKMIILIVNKELKTLVYLGGVLGVLMGLITCFFQ